MILQLWPFIINSPSKSFDYQECFNSSFFYEMRNLLYPDPCLSTIFMRINQEIPNIFCMSRINEVALSGGIPTPDRDVTGSGRCHGRISIQKSNQRLQDVEPSMVSNTRQQIALLSPYVWRRLAHGDGVRSKALSGETRTAVNRASLLLRARHSYQVRSALFC